MSAILNSAIWGLNKKKTFTHSFWLNLMMAAILSSSMLDSDTEQKKKKTSLIHSVPTLWWQPSLNLNTAILDSVILHKTLSQTNSFSLNLMMWDILNSAILLGFSHFEQKKTSLIHSDSTLWWQPSWILPSWIQLFCTTTFHSYILTHLDDCSHLEFCHVGFSHCHLGFRYLVIFSQIHSKTPSLHSTLTLTQTNSI